MIITISVCFSSFFDLYRCIRETHFLPYNAFFYFDDARSSNEASQSVSHVELIVNPEFIEGLSSEGTVDFIIGIPLFISFKASF